MQVLTWIEQSKLIKQSNLADLVSNDYLNDEYNENTILIADLFFNNDTERAVKFNVWSNLFTTISDAYAFFIDNPNSDVNFNMYQYSKDLVGIWKAVATVSRIDWVLEVEQVEAKNYIYSNWIHKVFKYYEEIIDNETKYFLFRQQYLPWTIINELFELKSMADLDWELVSLDTIPQTEWLEDIVYTWLDIPSIFVAEDIEALDDKNQSLIEKNKNIVYSLDRKQVMFETQFLQEIDQYKIFENIYIPDYAKNADWSVDLKMLWKVLATDTQLWTTWNIKYIKNTNDLIQDAINYEQKQLRKISSSTFIPLDFLWLESNWAISGNSRTIMISSFVKAIENKRQLLQDKLITPILEVFISENQIIKWSKEKVWKLVFWNKVLPQSGKELAEELKIARESGLISQYSAIKTYLNLNEDEEIKEELDLFTNDIQNDSQENMSKQNITSENDNNKPNE